MRTGLAALEGGSGGEWEVGGGALARRAVWAGPGPVGSAVGQ